MLYSTGIACTIVDMCAFTFYLCTTYCTLGHLTICNADITTCGTSSTSIMIRGI